MRYVGKEAITSIGHELYRNIENRVNAAARDVMVAEQIVPVRQLPGGEDAIGFTKDTTFTLSTPGTDTPEWGVQLGRREEAVGTVEADVNLRFVFSGFWIGPEVLAASRMGGGRTIDVRAAQEVALRVGLELEKMLWRGIDTPTAITGLDEGATDGGASAGAWSTRANCITDVTTCIDGVRESDWLGPRMAVVTQSLMTDLLVIENDYTDRVLLETLQRLFALGIYETDLLESTDTLLVGSPGAGPNSELTNFEIVRAAPITTWVASDEFGKGMKGLVFAKMSPKIYQATSLYEIDNITA
jgi:hypothetical protein